MNIKNLLVGGAMAITALAATTAASAATFLFSFTDASGDTSSGQFVTTGAGANQTVVSISGVFDGQAITGLSPYAAADEILITNTNPNYDFAGISFTVAALATDFNLTSSPNTFGFGSLLNSANDPGGFGTNPVDITNFTLTAVPEAATWTMMILGIGLLGAGLRLGSGKPERAIA